MLSCYREKKSQAFPFKPRLRISFPQHHRNCFDCIFSLLKNKFPFSIKIEEITLIMESLENVEKKSRSSINKR